MRHRSVFFQPPSLLPLRRICTTKGSVVGHHWIYQSRLQRCFIKSPRFVWANYAGRHFVNVRMVQAYCHSAEGIDPCFLYTANVQNQHRYNGAHIAGILHCHREQTFQFVRINCTAPSGPGTVNCRSRGNACNIHWQFSSHLHTRKKDVMVGHACISSAPPLPGRRYGH